MNLGFINRLRPGKSDLDWNIWNLYAEVAYFGFMFGIYQTFLNVYAIRLGASNTLIGLLNAMPSLVFAVGAIPAARLVERAANPIRLIVVTATLHRLGILALALIPFASVGYHAEAVVAVVTLMSVPQVMANISFANMFADVVPADMRARVVSVRNTLLGLTSTISAFLGSQYLGLRPEAFSAPFNQVFAFPLNYQIMFAVAFALSLFTSVHLARIRLGDTSAKSKSPDDGAPQGLLAPLVSLVRLLQSQPAFTRFLIATLVLHWGLFMPIPLYTLYWVRNLQASDSFIGLMLTLQSIAMMVTYPLLPRLAARLGNRGLMALAALLVALYPLATAFTTTLEPLLPIAVLGGVSGAMFGMSTFNLLLEVAPQERRPSYIAIFNTAAFSAGFLAPFVSTALLNFVNIQQDILIGFAARFVGLIAAILIVGVSGKQKPLKV